MTNESFDDPGTPRPPTESTNSRRTGILIDHFWKLFALAVLGCVVYMGNSKLSDRSDYQGMTITMTHRQDRPDPFELRTRIGKQLRPAAVVLKNEATAVVGYVSQADEDYVVLSTVFKNESRVETIVIPWDNILYIRLNLQEADTKLN